MAGPTAKSDGGAEGTWVEKGGVYEYEPPSWVNSTTGFYYPYTFATTEPPDNHLPVNVREITADNLDSYPDTQFYISSWGKIYVQVNSENNAIKELDIRILSSLSYSTDLSLPAPLRYWDPFPDSQDDVVSQDNVVSKDMEGPVAYDTKTEANLKEVKKRSKKNKRKGGKETNNGNSKQELPQVQTQTAKCAYIEKTTWDKRQPVGAEQGLVSMTKGCILIRHDSLGRIPPEFRGIYFEDVEDDAYLSASTKTALHDFTPHKAQKLKEVLKYLSTLKGVKITITDSAKKSVQLRCSPAFAYALVIRMKSTGDHLFTRIMSHAPPLVIAEMAKYDRGHLVNDKLAYRTLREISSMLLEPECVSADPTETDPAEAYLLANSSRLQELEYADATANFIAAVLKKWTMDKEMHDQWTGTAMKAERDRFMKELSSKVNELIAKVLERSNTDKAPANRTEAKRQQVGRAAVGSALILAGLFKFITNMEQEEKKHHDRAVFIVTGVLSCLGFAVPVPYVAAASGIVTFLAAAAIDYFWKRPSKGLREALKDQLLQNIDWPLNRNRSLPKLGLTNLSTTDVMEFKAFFDLTLRSAKIGWT